jgi:hypothetical protein
MPILLKIPFKLLKICHKKNNDTHRDLESLFNIMNPSRGQEMAVRETSQENPKGGFGL